VVTHVLPCRPNNDVRLATVKESPVLQREGFTQNSFEQGGNDVPTMEGERSSAGTGLPTSCTHTFLSEWTFAKQKWQRTKGIVRGDPKYETAQILPGHNEKLYA
jgi:hypothetical protein